MRNLAEICGLDADGDDSRVVSFDIDGDLLKVGEECDSYFAVDLNAEQAGLLIAYLQDALTKIEGGNA